VSLEQVYPVTPTVRTYRGFIIDSLRAQPVIESRCTSCEHVRDVISGTGSRFLLCRLSQADSRFPKYPPQPIVACEGYRQRQIIEKRRSS
jgi:hypothetical protein